MGEIGSDTKVHVVRAAPWKDAIIKLLEPNSPYRPWGDELGAKPGDAVLAILDTDPLAVIAELLPVDSDGGPDCVLAGFVDTEHKRRPALLELGTLTALTGLSFRRDRDGATVYDSTRLVEVLGERIEADWDLSYLHGHSTLAAARILLNSGGWCTGCRREIWLAGANARYHVHIHTVDVDPTAPATPIVYVPPPDLPQEYGPESIPIPDWPPPVRLPLDWPAVLCDDCHDRMRIGGFTGFLDYRFSLHPRCPECSARWTVRTVSGLSSWIPKDPWLSHTGCVRWKTWRCGACGHGFESEVTSQPQED